MISTVHEGTRLIVIRGFKINLDLRTYGNSTQLLQAKLKLLQLPSKISVYFFNGLYIGN